MAALTAVLLGLHVFAASCVVGVIAVGVFTHRSRGIVAAVYWTIYGVASLYVLPAHANEGARLFCYAFTAWIAILSIRSTLEPRARDRAHARNAKAIRRLFGNRAGARFESAVRRMRERESRARARNVAVLDVLKEEHANSKH